VVSVIPNPAPQLQSTMSFNELGYTRPSFTKDFHRDVYPFIVCAVLSDPHLALSNGLLQDPTKPELALNEKVVLITGGGRGIGVSIVEAFAKARAKTVILTGRSEAGLANTKNALESSYPETTFIPISVDIGSEESVDNLYKNLKSKVDHIGTFRDRSQNDLDLNVLSRCTRQ
jgi:hypothetical protein